MRTNPMAMTMNGLTLWMNLRYIRLKQALVTPCTPRKSPVTDVDTARLSWRYVGILVGSRNPMVIATKIVT